MIASDAAPERAKARLDQWLWFARFVKSRSLAARLCAAGIVEINGSAVTKANQAVRVGDVVKWEESNYRTILRNISTGAEAIHVNGPQFIPDVNAKPQGSCP